MNLRINKYQIKKTINLLTNLQYHVTTINNKIQVRFTMDQDSEKVEKLLKRNFITFKLI